MKERRVDRIPSDHTVQHPANAGGISGSVASDPKPLKRTSASGSPEDSFGKQYWFGKWIPSAPWTLELVSIDLSKFDEGDVAGLVSRFGGSMHGRLLHFPDRSTFSAAWAELCNQFGSGYFSAPNSLVMR
jgi:hypothetical protein